MRPRSFRGRRVTCVGNRPRLQQRPLIWEIALLGEAYTSAVFSETRYARNGDLRVAYRASPPGERDIVFIANWFTCCELLPELPSLQGWIEAMTSLGRLIFFDQPGTGASDPSSPRAMPTLEQWTDSITAVLDDLGSSEAVLIAIDGAVSTGAVYAATHPSRTSALVVMDGYADDADHRGRLTSNSAPR